jgi:hypothetical protein
VRLIRSLRCSKSFCIAAILRPEPGFATDNMRFYIDFRLNGREFAPIYGEAGVKIDR